MANPRVRPFDPTSSKLVDGSEPTSDTAFVKAAGNGGPLARGSPRAPSLVSKPGLSGPELIASIPDPSIEGYIARFDASDLKETFARVGVKTKAPRSSAFGNGYVVSPGTVQMALCDGQLYALLPGKHAWRTHSLQPKPFQITPTAISFKEVSRNRSNGRQDFEGGTILTLGPSEVGFAYNVPIDNASEENTGMGRGVKMLPPGTWVIRSPILVALSNFELTTSAIGDGATGQSYVQEVNVGVSDLARPRLVYVPYNHCAMFIDGHASLIAEQGFHWANPGIEIAGPWPQHEQRFTHKISAKTLDNMLITVEAECWVQMTNPECYVRVAGKCSDPKVFVGDKLTAKVKQHIASINALAIRAEEAVPEAPNDAEVDLLGDGSLEMPPTVGVPVAPAGHAADGLTSVPEDEEIIVTAAEDGPSEYQVFNRMKALLDEVRGFVDGRDTTASLAGRVQDSIGRAGLQLISLAALSVNLPPEIAHQIQAANEEQIIAQTQQATNAAKAAKHIAEKYAEIRKKKADREEETKDVENQVTLQRSKARLAEAEEFAKRQAKRAEQKVQQNLELQALEHSRVREANRIDNELALVAKEQEIKLRAEELEAERRLAALEHARAAEATRIENERALLDKAQEMNLANEAHEAELKLQALRHEKEREEMRVQNQLVLVERELELEAQRVALANAELERRKAEADAEAYRIHVEAVAERERVNQQTLVDTIMAHLGSPLNGVKIMNINGGGGAAGGEGGEGMGQGIAMIPQLLAMKELLAHSAEMDGAVRAQSQEGKLRSD